MIAVNEAQILSWLAAVWLPFARISGAMLTAPLFSASYIPARAKILFSVVLCVILLPLLPTPPAVNIISLEGMLLLANELLIGLCIGFIVQLVFDAIVLAGQLIANGMGLGFAMMVDPQRGVQVPVLSQYLLIICMLLFVAMGGHLEFIKLMARSFELWPSASRSVEPAAIDSVVAWGAELFAGAIRVSIPAIIALLVVQVAVGVISRAAPTLNLFAVGFPLAMLMGYLIVDQLIPNLLPVLSRLLNRAFEQTAVFLGG
ncbi:MULTISPECIES: flagellar biosynthetic protein FliR [Spongiibacter]|uniref:flagellar biosynthetic protein FliR n=1 Tax=Spongiibacter TaxID=630749 RepID=UPI0003B5F13A|nr:MULTISPECIES: flagellar biosynthetic protein FliR [Spongiibacter]MAY39671.1 flagellar biosynthetic protein FliR [Spongiibacter sp.]|tara:strand:+ start:4132 stop:4908 length:777 start_codon:yes stop_codon:yes gene_type:complete